MTSANTFRFGEFVLDARRRSLARNGQPTHLKPKEWGLLYYLVEHRQRLVTKDELIDALWPRQSITEANLTQTVYRVRRALGDSPRDAKWIETVSRLGYRFIGEVGSAGHFDDSSSPRSIAMMPFRDPGADNDPSDWSLGLAETVIRVLAEDPELDVRPLSAVMQAASGNAAEVRNALRVDALIDGDIDRREDVIRIVANLLDGDSGTLRCSKAWVVDRAAAGTAQERIAEDLREQVGSPRPRDRVEHERVDFEIPEARAAYLRGRYCWQQFTRASLQRSIELFDRALALSPRSAVTLAWRSAAWAALGNVGALTPRESAERARRDADLAITIDDRLAAGFEMRGAVQLYFDWNLEAALKSFELAIERDPESANAHHLYGNALAFSGSFGAALLSLQRAELIDPTSLITLTDIGVIHYLSGRFDEARDRLTAVLAQNEHFAHARLKLAFVLAAMGEYDRAVEQADRVQRESSSGTVPECALFHGLAGRADDARATLEELVVGGVSAHADPYSLALAHLGVDDRAAALQALEDAFEFRSRQLVLLALDPIWAPLRGDDAFRSLKARIGLAPE